MEHKYEATAHGVMKWAQSELEHVGRIVSVKDTNIQYSYALSTVNGMLHLRQALTELIQDPDYHMHTKDLKKTHDAVVRVIKHLIKDYNIDLNTINDFNTRHVLNFNFLQNKRNTRRANKNK
jgi:protein-tyrosine-phosphatase